MMILVIDFVIRFRLYILMFLIWKRQENLYFLRLETVDYRNKWRNMPSNTRFTTAKRIYNTYLSVSRSTLPPQWPNNIHDPSIGEIVDLITLNIDTAPDVTLFDDIAFVALKTIETIYHGTYVPDEKKKSDLSQLSEELQEVKTFRESSFYQAMRNDLRKILIAVQQTLYIYILK